MRIQASVYGLALVAAEIVIENLCGERINLIHRAADFVVEVIGGAGQNRRRLLETGRQILSFRQYVLARFGGIRIDAPCGKALKQTVQRGDDSGLAADVEQRLDGAQTLGLCLEVRKQARLITYGLLQVLIAGRLRIAGLNASDQARPRLEGKGVERGQLLGISGSGRVRDVVLRDFQRLLKRGQGSGRSS